MFSLLDIYRQMMVCKVFADKLIAQLRVSISGLPATCGKSACFSIPLTNGYALSVAIPSDKNRNLAITDSTDCVRVETALFKDKELIYDDELGYSDVCTHNFDAQQILDEYTRLMQILTERE